MNIKKAAMINAAGKYTKIGLSVLVSAILARILSVEDYGIVAVITVFSGFFSAFADMGISVAIVQKKELTEKDLNNIFSFTVYAGLGLMVLFALFSYPISLFYNNQVYIKLGILLSISLFFSTADMVPNGILNRNKKFTTIAVKTVVVYVVSSVITILLAKAGLKYYALALQSIISACLMFIVDCLLIHLRFRPRFEFESIKKILNYSSYQMAFNMVCYFSRNLDNLLTGKFIGTVELGYYNKAYNLMLYPVNNIGGIASPVLHPILSDYQDQKEVIYKKHVKLVKLLASTGMIIASFCFLAADEIIGIMYGDKWNNSIVCFKILSVAIIPQMINGSAGSIFQSLGNTKLLFFNGCINTVITIGAIVIGIFWGKSIEILSICVAIAYIFHFFSASYMLSVYGFGYSILKYAREFIPELLIFLIMVAAVFLFPFSFESHIISIIVKGVYLGVVFIISLFVSKDYIIYKSLIH